MGGGDEKEKAQRGLIDVWGMASLIRFRARGHQGVGWSGSGGGVWWWREAGAAYTPKKKTKQTKTEGLADVCIGNGFIDSGSSTWRPR